MKKDDRMLKIPGGTANAAGIDGKIAVMIFIGLALAIIIERIIRKK